MGQVCQLIFHDGDIFIQNNGLLAQRADILHDNLRQTIDIIRKVPHVMNGCLQLLPEHVVFLNAAVDLPYKFFFPLSLVIVCHSCTSFPVFVLPPEASKPT